MNIGSIIGISVASIFVAGVIVSTVGNAGFFGIALVVGGLIAGRVFYGGGNNG